MIRSFWILALSILWTGCSAPKNNQTDFAIKPSELQSGLAFMTEESQAQQADDFANPGFLWAETGEALFSDGDETAACKSCHTDPAKEFAALADRYPGIDEITGRLINIEGRINLCRTRHQDRPVLPYESEDLLALTTFVNAQGRGRSTNYTVSEKLRPHLETGKDYFFARRGQLNLSCHQCHDQNWGRKMRGDTVSQGHINGFPAYRNDWQTLGSSHRRFQACDVGVRAEPRPLGSQIYIDLEVYLKARGNGLTVETPAIRR